MRENRPRWYYVCVTIYLESVQPPGYAHDDETGLGQFEGRGRADTSAGARHHGHEALFKVVAVHDGTDTDGVHVWALPVERSVG